MSEDKLTLMASVGNRGANRPDDVDRIKERLLALGYPGVIRFRDTTHGVRHSGYLNDERVLALEHENFYWGTSWFADVLVKAGAHYRERHLTTHPYAAPIALNDVSRPRGRNNHPHSSHDTGLAVDLRLPRTDGLVGVSISDRLRYDSVATDAIIRAFLATDEVGKLLIYDKDLIRRLQPDFPKVTFIPDAGHHDHIHLLIKAQARGNPTGSALTLNSAVGWNLQSKTDDITNIRNRLHELGFDWLAQIPDNATTTPGDLQHAIDLFQAIVRGIGSPYRYKDKNKKVLDPPQRLVDGQIRPGSDDLQWLNAENAPRWQKIPAGTIDVFEDRMRPLEDELRSEGAQFDDLVGAIRLFQTIVNGLDAPTDDPKKADGAIHPDRKTHRWLSAPNAPGWVKLQQPDGYKIVQPGDVHTSTWLAGLLSAAPSPLGPGTHVEIDTVRAIICDIVLPIGANGSLDAAAAQAIIDRFKAVTEPATAELRCHQSLIQNLNLTGCQPDDKVSDKHLRVRVQPPPMTGQTVPVDSPPVVRLQPPDPQRPSLWLVPGPTAPVGEPPEEFLALILPGPLDASDESNLGVRLPLRARSHDPISGDPGTSVQIKTGPAETLPFPTITPPTLPDLTFDLIPSVQAPQVLMAPAVEETPAPVPGLRVNEASLSLTANGTAARLVIDLEADVPGLLRLWHWRYELNQPLDALTGLWYAGQRIVGNPEEKVDWAERCWLCAQFDVEVPLADLGLPLHLAPQAMPKIVVRIGGSPEKQLDVELTGGITDPFSIDLGSPLARLDLNATGLRFSLSTFGGFSVTLPEKVTAGLHLDLFDRFGDEDAAPVVNNIWSHAQGQHPWLLNLSCAADLSRLGAALDVPGEGNGAPQPAAPALAEADEADADTIEETEAAAPLELIWQDGWPLVDPDLLSVLVNAMADTISGEDSWVNPARQLLGLAGDLPVLDNPMQAAFAPPTQRAIQFDLAGRALLLRLGMGITGSDGQTILAGEGEFRFVIDADETGMALMQPGALRMSRGDVILQTSTAPEYRFGELLSLRIPGGSRFRFSCDPKDPQLAWDADESRKNTDARITLSVPATGDCFTFEMESFRIHSAGIDLRGAVRTDSVTMGGAGFAAPVGVKGVQRNGVSASDDKKPRPHQIGEIEFKNSRLVYGSLQASAKLPYFDDAVGTLTLFLSQGENQSLACAGTLDISGIDEFHIDDLFITVQVDHLQLGVKYDKQWSSKASLTGRVKFQPPKGRSASEMGMLSSLFAGVVLDFEDLDPLAGKGAWKLTTPPKRFDIADILLVDMRGVSIGLEGEGEGRKIADCQLLGDITIQELPGIDSSLTFGGLKLTPKGKDKPPKFEVSRIAAQFSAPGGFKMSGELENISTEQETGFAGGFTLKMSALPELGGMLKLTRVRLTNGKVAPSLALFVEYAAQVPLLYGFYLRRLGIGLGVRQALRGLEPDSPIPADQRLVKFIDNPAGLPDPIFASSWRPVQRPQLSWMLVGAGLITFGNLGDADPHLIAGSFLLSLDQDLRLLLGTNLWLFTSPDETRNAEFLQRPVARGGMELSVGDGYLKTYLRTIKGPKLGDKAPPLLAEVLSAVETSFFFQVDRNGFITEVGWPWETRIAYDIGDFFHGELQAGFRYGFYRGVLIFGLNFAIAIRIEASQTLSFGVMGVTAAVGLEVKGAASFRASFVGALDVAGLAGYLMGDVRLDAMVSVKASASVRIKIGFIKIRISFSATLSVSISAALTAAMTSAPEIGFSGEARIAISVCGYGISGSVAFKYNDGLIEQVQDKLKELLPEPLVSGQQAEAAMDQSPLPPLWHYRFHWLEPLGGNGGPRLRILLFPSAETPYPIDNLQLRFGLALKPESDATQKAHLVGSQTGVSRNNNQLSWTQDLSRRLYEDSKADLEQEARAYLLERRAYHEELRKRLDDLNTRQNSLTDQERVEQTNKEQEWDKLTKEGDDEVKGVLDALADVGVALQDAPLPTLADLLDGTYLGRGYPLQGSIEDHRVDPNYDKDLAQASNAPGEKPEQQIGLLLAELLTLLKDSNAKVGDPARGYRAAHLMDLVLEFETPPDWRQRLDPVPDIIDLDAFTLAGQDTPLESVLGRNALAVEYDLIPLPVHQEPGRICLAWDFLREDEAQGARQGAGRDDFAPYAELERYIVIRFNVNRPGDRPRVVATQPAWIILEQGGQDSYYLRPPFQFIDDDLDNVNEGDLIQYRVEAHAPDRLLASTLINVTRQTTKPLPIVGQTLALHKRGADQESLLFIVPAWEPIQVDVEEVSGGEDGATQRAVDEAARVVGQLRIQYRRSPAARFGAYGYDLRPTPPLRWVDGLPARRGVLEFPQVKFAESSESRPLPWEETDEFAVKKSNGDDTYTSLPLPWAPITVVRYDPDAGGKVVEVIGFRCEVHPGDAEEQPWPTWDADRAVEFYIGRVKAGDGKQPEERSPLTKCRHAVAAAEPERWLRYDDTQDLYTLDLSPGNTVDAFEELVKQRETREFLPPQQMQLAVTYPEPVKGQAEGDAPEIAPPEIVLTWRHDRFVDADTNGDPFNPVVGYRIHCFDRYDPGEYPPPDGGVQDRTLVTVRAIPERLYRATPESVVVASAPTNQPGTFEPSWTKVPGLSDSVPDDATPESLPDFKRLLWYAGPIFLHDALVKALTHLCTKLDGGKARCRLVMHHPLAQRLRPEETPFTSLVESLATQLDERSDPYGWWLAEALGMSCECHFLDHDDVPIQAEVVREAILTHGIAAPAAFCFFQAADTRTLLNVVRVVVGVGNPDDLKPALWYRVKEAGTKGSAPIVVLPSTVDEWPADTRLTWDQAPPSPEPNKVYLPQRWQKALTQAKALQVYTQRRYVEMQQQDGKAATKAATMVSVELPIAADGTITYGWSAPDLWSHRYKVAIEFVRRHDALWHLLRTQGDGDVQPQPIPDDCLREVRVDRTRALVSHNLIVTPLPGSIQALVFRHPAAFAAAASAVNATHGQYAGQTVILERRIDARNKLVKDYYQPFDIDWEQYKPHQLADEAVPSIWHQSADAATLPLALKPVSGTEPGIYGADRYVYPDLPGYYQYRVAAYSAAGRAQSPMEVSGWVDPIYDEERQRPQAMRPQEVVFDPQDKRLTMKLPVVHAAHHLRPELRELWRDADEVIPELVGKSFGDLPDLYLTYQLYIRTNSISETTAVYVPLYRLVGPMARPQPANGQNLGPGFKLENQTPGANIKPATVLEDDGLLFWSLGAELEQVIDPSLLAGLNTAPERAAEFIAVAVQRRGVWSELLIGAPAQVAAPQP